MVKTSSRNVIVVPPSADPVWMTASYPAECELDFVRNTWGVRSLHSKEWFGIGTVSEEPLGTLYWTHTSEEAPNALGAQLAAGVGGRCFLAGSSQKLTKAVFEEVFKLYNQLCGKRVAKRTEEKTPQKARSARAFYIAQYINDKKAQLTGEKKAFSMIERAELKKESSIAWDTESKEVIAKFEALAAEDLKREQAELEEYKRQNPKKPKAARNPYQMYFAENGRKPGAPLRPGVIPWKEMTAEQKKKYETAAELDKARFAEELAKYEANCAAAGKQPQPTTRGTKHKSGESEEQVYTKRLETQLAAFNVPPPPMPTPSKKRKLAKKVAQAVGNDESDHE